MNKQIADLEKRVNTKLETLVKTTNDATKSVSDDLASLRKDYVAMIKVANEDFNKVQIAINDHAIAVNDHAKRINELEKKCN